MDKLELYYIKSIKVLFQFKVEISVLFDHLLVDGEYCGYGSYYPSIKVRPENS